MMTMNHLGSETAESEPESISTGGIPAVDSTIVVELPELQLQHRDMVELLTGAVSTARLLGLSDLLFYASAAQLPDLAVAAAEIDDIPEGFQLRQIDADTGELSDLPDNITKLSVASLLHLEQVCQAA